MDITGKPVLFFFLKGNRGGEVELILVKEVGKGLGGMEGRETGQVVINKRGKVFLKKLYLLSCYTLFSCLSVSVYSLSNKLISICRDWN